MTKIKAALAAVSAWMDANPKTAIFAAFALGIVGGLIL